MKNNSIISLWSGPRNVSTALMYSFGEREDTIVMDEPLYGHYLRITGADHPGAGEVMAAMTGDPEEAWNQVRRKDAPIVFLKNMAHHAIDLNEEWYKETIPVLLIRDPEEMLPSLQIQNPSPILRDTGLLRQAELFTHFVEAGRTPVVLDARELLLNPEFVLSKMFEKMNLPFCENMLHWNSGPHPCDGVWAPYWYHEVHKSTGFKKYTPKEGDFPEELRPLLNECRPYYLELYQHSIKHDA